MLTTLIEPVAACVLEEASGKLDLGRRDHPRSDRALRIRPRGPHERLHEAHKRRQRARPQDRAHNRRTRPAHLMPLGVPWSERSPTPPVIRVADMPVSFTPQIRASAYSPPRPNMLGAVQAGGTVPAVLVVERTDPAGLVTVELYESADYQPTPALYLVEYTSPAGYPTYWGYIRVQPRSPQDMADPDVWVYG